MNIGFCAKGGRQEMKENIAQEHMVFKVLELKKTVVHLPSSAAQLLWY